MRYLLKGHPAPLHHPSVPGRASPAHKSYRRNGDDLAGSAQSLVQCRRRSLRLAHVYLSSVTEWIARLCPAANIPQDKSGIQVHDLY